MKQPWQEDFQALADKLKNRQADTIKVGMSTCGIAAGAAAVFEFLQKEVEVQGMSIEVKKCGCLGMCYAEPLVEVNFHGQQRVIYKNVNEALALKIVKEHLLGKTVIKDSVCEISPQETRIVLRNCGQVDPESLEDYLAQDGYQALYKVLNADDSSTIIEELKTSGLRGRGGAGFPTWMKWNFTRSSQADERFIICNADEGDPGAYMDRSVLEGDPFSIIEGMTIAALAIGARQGFVYIRAEYPLAIRRVAHAIESAKKYGLLGDNILGSDIGFDLEIRLGAGAFVCGEETALIASIEGKRGTPVPRPPFPSVKGLWGKPTCINNVETLANIAPIILHGGQWFAAIGTAESKGTKVFAVTGKVARSGLVEIAMGTPLNRIIYDIAGGTQSGKPVLAVQTGGPSGGVIPQEFLETPVSYEHLQKLGSIMGSGGMIVMDTDDCIVDIAKFYLGFCVEESCGKCAPCRIGGKQMLGILQRIAAGQGISEDINTLKRISNAMQKASLCGLGQTAPNPVISTLKHYEQEYLDHIVQKKCRAMKCKNLIAYDIIQDKCKRCTLCFKHCPTNAITGDREKGFFLKQALCIKCGKCFDVCKFDAIARA